MEIGKVYKQVANNNLLRTPIFVGSQYVMMMNVDQDNTQTIEFQLNTSADYSETVGAFPSNWEVVEGLDIKDQVNAFMAPKYV